MSKFGFIGCGNMGGTLARAVAKSVKSGILVSDYSNDTAKIIAKEIGATATTNEEIAKTADFIFLGVKPQVLPTVLNDLVNILNTRKDRFVLVSMAAGVDTDSVSKHAKGNYPVIRIMPNTPAAVGKGMILYCQNSLTTPDDINKFLDAIKYAGKADSIEEELIDAASAVSGCGPAFVYMFIEALAQGAIECGLPKEKAIKYAAQTVLGAGEMVLSTDKTPEELKIAVCSPAGSTIEGVKVLESLNLKGITIDAIKASYKRTKELGK